MCNRAATNRADIGMVRVNYPKANSVTIFCVIHNLINIVKTLITSDPFSEHFRKLWRPIVQHPSKESKYAAETFGNPVKICRGVRLFFHVEQMYQLSTQVK